MEKKKRKLADRYYMDAERETNMYYLNQKFAEALFENYLNIKHKNGELSVHSTQLVKIRIKIFKYLWKNCKNIYELGPYLVAQKLTILSNIKPNVQLGCLHLSFEATCEYSQKNFIS